MPAIFSRRRVYAPRSTRRRVYRRSRVGLRRSRKIYRRRGRADGMYREKVTLQGEIGTPGGASFPNTAYNYISWFEQKAGGTQDTGLYTNNFQFKDMARNFSFYQIYGMKLKILPYNLYPEQSDGKQILGWQIGSFIGADITTEPSNTNLQNSRDYKTYSGDSRLITRYYKVINYLKGIKEGWMPINRQPPAEYLMNTAVVANLRGFDGIQSVKIARFQLDYYVKFKTRRHSSEA